MHHLEYRYLSHWWQVDHAKGSTAAPAGYLRLIRKQYNGSIGKTVIYSVVLSKAELAMLKCRVV